MTADTSLINFARYSQIPSIQGLAGKTKGLLGRLNFNPTLCKLRSLLKFLSVFTKCVTLLHRILVIFSLLVMNPLKANIYASVKRSLNNYV